MWLKEGTSQVVSSSEVIAISLRVYTLRDKRSRQESR